MDFSQSVKEMQNKSQMVKCLYSGLIRNVSDLTGNKPIEINLVKPGIEMHYAINENLY